MSKKQKRCIFCNNVMKNSPKRVMYHKMCIIDSIYDTLYDNKPLSKIHYKGSQAYGINISEIRKCVGEDKNGKIKQTEETNYKKEVSSLLKCIDKINAETEIMKKILQNWSE